MHIPRIIISGLSGGAGKTMLSLGVVRALSRSGVNVRAFKKGPDYIDAAWLALAAGAPQGNLDPFFSPGGQLAALFTAACRGRDMAVIEGNRGLFDGLDITGSCSTAEVSRLIKAPVLLIVDCTKMTRTTAALVKGCLEFEPGVTISGVILNRTSNSRHEALARRAVEELAGVPVVGALPRRSEPFIVERHMGLAGTDEHGQADALLESLADFIAAHVNLEQIRAQAQAAPPLDAPIGRDERHAAPLPRVSAGGRPRIGYAKDAALWFYYQENLEALERAGATLTPLSLLSPEPWPEIDGLYLGGGLPELHAESLAANRPILEHIAALSRSSLPIYAECGGFMVLADTLLLEGRAYPMAGVFGCAVEFCEKPQGLGYIEAETVRETPFHPLGARFRGHEFHFSRCLEPASASGENRGRQVEAASLALRLHKGRGMATDADGLAYDGLLSGNTFASYTHIYAPALPHWAPRFVKLCGGRE